MKYPALNSGNAGERDDSMLAEIRRRLRCAVLREIVRRCHHDPAHRTDAGRDRLAFRQRADPHRDVEPLLHQVDRPIEQVERHRHVGKTIEKLGHDREHM